MWGEEAGADRDDPGFDILVGVLADSEIDNLFEPLAGAKLTRTRAGVRNLLSHPAVSTLARDPRLTAIAAEILGDDTFAFRATLFDKSHGANWLVTWHQDTALPLRARREVAGWGSWSVKAGVLYAHAPAAALSRVVALRVHLDDSTAANGPLRVLPETHRMGLLTDTQIREVSRTVPPVECIVRKGDVVTMRPLLVHSSSKAAVPAPRRVLHIEYATSRDLGGGLELAVA